jgi:hypothetical protein
MARDQDFNPRDDYGRSDLYEGRRGQLGRDDAAAYGETGHRGRADEGRSWQGGDRYGNAYGERAYAERVYGRGRGGGGHSLESFGRGRIAGNDYGQRGYGETGVAQNANDQGGVGQTGFSQSGYNRDDYTPSRSFYGEDGGARGAYRGGGYRSGGYGGSGDIGLDLEANRYLNDIAGGEHRGRGPKNYTRSDSRIAEDINDRLSDAGDLDATHIEVAVKGGEVTLTGTVASRHAKRRAEDLADDVSGIKHVQNNLRVSDAGETMSSISADNAKF